MARGGGLIPEPDRPVGELVEQLVDDGRAYANAEIGLLKARAEDYVASYKTVAIFGAAAFLLAIGASVAIALTLVLVLSELTNPYVGGLLAILLIGGAAGLCAFYAKRSLDRAGKDRKDD